MLADESWLFVPRGRVFGRWPTIYSRDHFLISLVLGVVVAFAPAPLAVPLPTVVTVAVVTVAGVAIDADHFLAARYNRGDWAAVRRCLRDPRIAFLDQSEIFEPNDVLVLQRLFSHVVIAGVVVPGLWLAGYGNVAYLVGLSLYVHLLSDLVHDNREYEQTCRQYLAEVDDE